MYPKHVEVKIYQLNYLVASSWYSTLFHEEDARSNNHQVEGKIVQEKFTLKNVFITNRTTHVQYYLYYCKRKYVLKELLKVILGPTAAYTFINRTQNTTALHSHQTVHIY